MIGRMRDMLELLFPRGCVMCGQRLTRTEEHVCVSCVRGLPRTHYGVEAGNPLERDFWGRTDVRHVSSFFYYHKDNPACRILHELKYYHCPQIGVYMGKVMAGEMIPSGFFKEIDLLVPVPLAASKKRKRGYNQCDKLADGISAATSIPVCTDVLVRRVANPTQTRKRRMERWENVQGIFSVTDAASLSGKHILLIDDVVTTGATLIACVEALSVVPNLSVSILTLAVARE